MKKKMTLKKAAKKPASRVAKRTMSVSDKFYVEQHREIDAKNLAKLLDLAVSDVQKVLDNLVVPSKKMKLASFAVSDGVVSMTPSQALADNTPAAASPGPMKNNYHKIFPDLPSR